MNFYRPMFERQDSGRRHRHEADSATSDSYFNARPYLSRLGAIASPQSRPIDRRRLAGKASRRIDCSIRRMKMYQDRPLGWIFGWFPIESNLAGKPSRLHDRIQLHSAGPKLVYRKTRAPAVATFCLDGGHEYRKQNRSQIRRPLR